MERKKKKLLRNDGYKITLAANVRLLVRVPLGQRRRGQGDRQRLSFDEDNRNSWNDLGRGGRRRSSRATERERASSRVWFSRPLSSLFKPLPKAYAARQQRREAYARKTTKRNEKPVAERCVTRENLRRRRLKLRERLSFSYNKARCPS